MRFGTRRRRQAALEDAVQVLREARDYLPGPLDTGNPEIVEDIARRADDVLARLDAPKKTPR